MVRLTKEWLGDFHCQDDACLINPRDARGKKSEVIYCVQYSDK